MGLILPPFPDARSAVVYYSSQSKFKEQKGVSVRGVCVGGGGGKSPADTLLPIALFLRPALSSSSPYLTTISFGLFICPSPHPHPNPPPSRICFTVLYLSSLCKILLSLFSTLIALHVPLAAVVGGVR